MSAEIKKDTPEDNADVYLNSISNQNVKWDRIYALSSLLLQLAYQKNWSSLLERHKERDALLDSFFREAIAEDIIDKIKKDILTIKEQDEEIVRLVKNNQQQLGDESQQLLTMKKRINSYLSAGK